MVERFFAEISRNRIRRGAFKGGPELKTAIMEYPENHNAHPSLSSGLSPQVKSSKKSPGRNKR
jgi:hypothetical protein